MAGRFDDAEDRAARRRLVAALGAAQADRLAGDDARDGVAGVHGVGVHHPGHDLGVGVDVRRRDVLLGADEDLDLGEEPAGQALELLLAELLRVDDDAALAAAVRDADDRALPGHPHREGLDLVERDVLVVADAALGRPAAQVVLDAVAGEDLDRPVVHVDREVDGELAARLAQDQAHARIEVEALGGEVELPLRDFPRVDLRSDVLGGHGRRNLRVGALGTPSAGRLPDDPTGRISRSDGCRPSSATHLRPSIAESGGASRWYRAQGCRNLVAMPVRVPARYRMATHADAARTEVRPDRRARRART